MYDVQKGLIIHKSKDANGSWDVEQTAVLQIPCF